MLRKHFLILLILPFLSSCFKIKEPEFKSIEKITIKHIKGNEYALTANIVMHNPNGIGTKILKSEIDIFAKDLRVGKVVLSEKRKIAKKKDFRITIELTLNLKDFFEIKKFNDILSLLKEKKITLNFKGDITFKIGLFNKTAIIKHKEEIKF